MKTAKWFQARIATVLAGAALILGAAGSVQAQDPAPDRPYSWGARIGVFYPTQGVLKNQASGGWFHGGVDFYPNFHSKVLGGDAYFGVDFNFREGNGASNLVVPLHAKLKWNVTPLESHVKLYLGLGAGIYFTNTRFLGGNTQPGVKFIVGVNLTERFFIEANYDYVGGFTDSQGNGVRVDGLTFAAGIKF